MKTPTRKGIARITREDQRVVDEALKRGVRDAMLRHKREDRPVVVERNGTIEWIKPEDLGY